MSFTTDVKEELTRVLPTCSHCDKALLSALIRIEGTLFLMGSGTCRLEVSTDLPSVARLIVRLVHGVYGLQTELVMRRSVLHKTPNYLIEVPSQEGLEEALNDLGVLGTDGLTSGIADHLVKKRCCAAAYLRGAFLGCGFVSNPRGDFHFEMTVESADLASGLVSLMSDWGINAKIMQRRSSSIVYLKSGTAISEFLALVGANQCALAMENERVIKSVRNDVNRRVNAELANQQKSTEASVGQIMAIHTVVDRYGIDALPAALQEVIRLRVAHPDASMKELGEYADPPLSKSAIAHRMRRIEEMARAE
ncbi:MAG: DNA-binding protein WhiA [Eggerthellaceae bacterium]|nr:DNA-binding protein WhiA [Eggerthellaceae bacterium]